jgi:hypothetical protein
MIAHEVFSKEDGRQDDAEHRDEMNKDARPGVAPTIRIPLFQNRYERMEGKTAR